MERRGGREGSREREKVGGMEKGGREVRKEGYNGENSMEVMKAKGHL